MHFMNHCVCVCSLNRDSNVEAHRRQNSNTDVGHPFITRRQISEHENMQESPEVTFLFVPIFIAVFKDAW